MLYQIIQIKISFPAKQIEIVHRWAHLTLYHFKKSDSFIDILLSFA